MTDVLIAGGGPSGLMAGIIAARSGKKVLIIDQKEILGKKILVTGNGRCNLTNALQAPIFYRSLEGGNPGKVLEKFSYQDLLAFFTKLGLYAVSREGYFYPYSGKAGSVLDVLKLEVKRLGISVRTSEKILAITKAHEGFRIQTDKGVYQGEKVVCAMGGKAFPKMGSDGSGYALLKALGHSVTPLYPSLVPITCAEKSYKKLAGIRAFASIALYAGETFLGENTGEILFTKEGLSGIPAFQVSRYAAKATKDGGDVFAYLDFMPDFTDAGFHDYLKARIKNMPDRTVGDFYKGLFPDRLSELLIRISGVHDDEKAGNLSDTKISGLVRAAKHYRSRVTGTKGFNDAQVTCGGVPLGEICPDTMESKIVPGLYLTGEILDVDGICGGYNLQWAFSSGYVAGRAL